MGVSIAHRNTGPHAQRLRRPTPHPSLGCHPSRHPAVPSVPVPPSQGEGGAPNTRLYEYRSADGILGWTLIERMPTCEGD